MHRKFRKGESGFTELMILHSITIANSPSQSFMKFELSEGVNLINAKNTADIYYAMRLVMNHKILSPPNFWTRRGCEIGAVVSIAGNLYTLRFTKGAVGGDPELKCRSECGSDATDEYLYTISHCTEHDFSDVFDGNEESALLKLLQYANEDLYYAPNELTERTGGLSKIKAFRAYLHKFIKNFKEETIREGKDYEIILKSNAEYDVRHRTHPELPVFLSESERTVFKYLCFLRTAEFWCGFEDLRNLHSVKKPLLIKDFLSRLDESIDTKDLLSRSAALGRQIIILS